MWLVGNYTKARCPQGATTGDFGQKETDMDNRFGYYIFAGLAIGVLVGLGIGSASGNVMPDIGFGAMFGVFIGWFVAAAMMQRSKSK